MSPELYESMRTQLGELFPKWNNVEVKHACGVISDKLRRLNTEIHSLDVGTTVFTPAPVPEWQCNLEICETTVHVRVTVDQ